MILDPISVGFLLAFYEFGGVESLPSEKDVTVELGQCNLAQICTSLKTAPVPNLVIIAQSMTSL